MWEWWQLAARANVKEGIGVPQYLFVHKNGSAWTMHEFHLAIRNVLHRWIGLDLASAMLFTTYSLRKMWPTVAGIVKVDRIEELAVGA